MLPRKPNKIKEEKKERNKSKLISEKIQVETKKGPTKKKGKNKNLNSLHMLKKVIHINSHQLYSQNNNLNHMNASTFKLNYKLNPRCGP